MSKAGKSRAIPKSEKLTVIEAQDAIAATCALILEGKREKCREQLSQVREALARADESLFSSLGLVPASLLLWA
jgi:hypothetical protein